MNGWMVYAQSSFCILQPFIRQTVSADTSPMLGASQSQASREEAADCSGDFFLSHILSWVKKKTFSHIFPPLQVVGLLASHVQASIRGSLLVSLLLQLVDDRDDRVAQTAARSLALLVHTLDDSDKLNQVVTDSLQHITIESLFLGACKSFNTDGQR